MTLGPCAIRRRISWQCISVLSVAGITTGLLSGRFGVGGGFIVVPAIVFATGVAIHRAVATSLMVVAIVSASAFLSMLAHGREIPWPAATMFLAGALAGMAIGTILGRWISGVRLKQGFALLLGACIHAWTEPARGQEPETHPVFCCGGNSEPDPTLWQYWYGFDELPRLDVRERQREIAEGRATTGCYGTSAAIRFEAPDAAHVRTRIVPALIAALASPAFYIGALGSKRTHAKRIERLTAAGVGDNIGRIHAPVGLDLGGRSPREIAVSILAEVIQVRYRGPSRAGGGAS